MIQHGQQRVYFVNDAFFHCGTSVTMGFIGGKWKSVLVWYLRNGTLRFSAIKKLIPDITDKMLSIQLKSLEEDGLIDRQVFGTKPPNRVEYSLTAFGKSLVPVIEKITNWGIQYAETNGKLVDV